MPFNNDQNFEDFLNKAKSHANNKWVVIGLVVLFFAALILVSIDWVFGALVHTRKEVTVPDITKKSVTQALNMHSVGRFHRARRTRHPRVDQPRRRNGVRPQYHWF